MDKINVGIIGTGFIGPAHVEALRRLGFVDVVALAEANQELADKKAASLSIPCAYGDYRKMLERKDLVAVHNCTPNALHYEITTDIIAAGKHVVSEKPLAMNSKESRDLVDLADKAGIANAIDFNYRFYPLIQHLRAMRIKGKLGAVYAVHGSYLQDWLFLDTDYNWRVEPEGGGESRAVGDVGSHWCDEIQYVTGLKIVRVYADLMTIHKTRKKPKFAIETYAGKVLKPEDYEEKPIVTEDYATVLLEFDSGARGAFTVCQCAAGRKNRLYFEIDASKCAIAWDQEEPEEMWFGYREKPNEIMVKDAAFLEPEARPYAHYPGGHPEGYPDGPKNFFRNFYNFIREGKDPKKGEKDFATFLDGHHEILIVEAVLESQRTKKWVDVKYDR
mgnify:CR=1 FL=1